MQRLSLVFRLLLLLITANAIFGQRYEFKHSFRPPFHLGRSGSIPFWDFGGNTIVFDEYIRLTPNMESKLGWIWNTARLELDAWELHLEFHIGGGGRIGADGMALWYAAEPKMEGPVFGSKDYFNGIAILLDTFDNDAKYDNPVVSLVMNDGTKSFQGDGGDLVVASCKHINWREQKTKMKVTYKDNLLQVVLEAPATLGSPQECFSYQVVLPKGLYLGLSAATGLLKDNHDVFSLITYNLGPWRRMEPNIRSVEGQAQEAPSTEQQVHVQPAQMPPSQPQPQPVQMQAPQSPPPTQQQPQPVQMQASQVPPPSTQQLFTQSQPAQAPLYTMPNQQNQALQQQSETMRLVQELAATVKQVQVQVQGVQGQQNQLASGINQLTADMRALATARSTAGAQSASQQAVIAEAFEKLLAIVSDTKTMIENDIAQLRNSLLDIKNVITAAHSNSGATKELVSAVNDINKKITKVQGTVELAKREQESLVTDLQTNKEVLVAKIAEGTSFGFWTYFIFFQIIFALAFIWLKKTREDANKKWL